jgi:hypothetical protein
MMMGGFGPFMMLAAIGIPVIVVSGVAVGLAARRWWHLIPGAAVPPVAYWLYYSIFHAVDHFLATLPFVAIAGAVWVVASHAAKRAWTR